MKVKTNITGLKGLVAYRFDYGDGSSTDDSFEFKDFFALRYLLFSKPFFEELKEEYGYDNIILKGIYLTDKDGRCVINLVEDNMTCDCINDVSEEQFNTQYDKHLAEIKGAVKNLGIFIDNIQNKRG